LSKLLKAFQRAIVAKDMQMIQQNQASLPNYSAARSKQRSAERNKCGFLTLPSRNVIEKTGQLFRNMNIATHHLNL
jgi:hypothetical protein